MRDQIAALEWVRNSISAFGGDHSVTIAGQSADQLIEVCAALNIEVATSADPTANHGTPTKRSP